LVGQDFRFYALVGTGFDGTGFEISIFGRTKLHILSCSRLDNSGFGRTGLDISGFGRNRLW